MERLTDDQIKLNSILFGINCNFPPHCGNERTKEATEFLQKVFDRLKELEIKLEQGTLVELPCKVGDTVYYHKTLCDGENTVIVNSFSVCRISIAHGGRVVINEYGHALDFEQFGKTVFLTQAEAQTELEKRK